MKEALIKKLTQNNKRQKKEQKKAQKDIFDQYGHGI